MKYVLIIAPPSADRFTEAIRVAAGLSQQPSLQVSLRLPSSDFCRHFLLPTDYLGLFGEKGIAIYADAGWMVLLSPSVPLRHPEEEAAEHFDVNLPF